VNYSETITDEHHVAHQAADSARDVAQGRLTQVFKFLKALNELRNPVPRDLSAYSQILWLDRWPLHPTIIVQRGDRQDNEDDTGVDAEMEPTIRIQRAQLTPCPNPPALLDDWLKPSWQSIDGDVEVLESQNFISNEKETITVGFVDDPKRVEALTLWKTTREKWAAAERPAIAARQLFERIHALWSTMQREGDRVELVLADGMLDETTQLIRHPVLLQRVNFEFDPAVPEFRFSTGTEKVELHRALLRLVPSIELRMIADFRKQLETQPVEPLGGESTSGFLRSLVQGLFTDGEFLGEKAPSVTTWHPSIWREPIIFLRPRSAGLNTTLDSILERFPVAALRPLARPGDRDATVKPDLRLLNRVRPGVRSGAVRGTRVTPREARGATCVGGLPDGRRAHDAPAPTGPRG
jgi:hypothetical protein